MRAPRKPRGSNWTHKTKYNKQAFLGSYDWVRGERIFLLTRGKREFTFDSPISARQAGWKMK